MAQQDIPFTRKQLEQVAREVGFRGPLIGSVTRISSDIDAWITRNQFVPESPSSVLKVFLERHGFFRSADGGLKRPPKASSVRIEMPPQRKKKYVLPGDDPDEEEGDDYPLIRRNRLALTLDQVTAINGRLQKGYAIMVYPTDEGVQIQITKRHLFKSPFPGRTPIRWTDDERPKVEEMRERISKITLQQKLDLARTLPLPKGQTYKFPGHVIPSVFNLYKDIDQHGKRCADRVCNMRINVLLLKWAASQVSGRPIFY